MSNDNGSCTAETISVLRGLRQVRQFTDEPVPQEAIDDILEVARWTGSGMNQQPWQFVLVRDQDTLKQIAAEEGKGSHLARAALGIVILISGEEGAIATYDEARLTERMMLAAAAHGIGSGIWWFKDGGAAARRILGIPEDQKLRTAISFGYADKDPSAPPPRNAGRKPLSELVHDGKY